MIAKKRVVVVEEWGKIIVMDSAASMSPDETGQIVVAGSHGAETTARHMSRYLPFGVFLNDAGVGKNQAGISCLHVFEVMSILGATVDCMSARIGDGEDHYASGIVSAVNSLAEKSGVRVGMRVAEACQKMIQAKTSSTFLYTTEVVYQIGNRRIVLADSISFLNESHRECVVVCGSHCAHTTLEWTKDLNLKSIFLNDAGKGKENQGISALPAYDKFEVPAAAIDCMTAMIGHARDAWETGLISVANGLASTLGVKTGMKVQDAAKSLLNSL
ncbi:MAG: hypothetical protein FJ110_07400 [Deltaproteobacteria bacterium]|nr:hypothetical protein [Deltaproteobacteria bacterium]